MTEPTSRSDRPVSKCPFARMSEGLPLLGNTLDFLSDTTTLLVSNYHKYGPIYRIRVLWLKFTVILGFEAKQFLIDGRERHLNRHPVFDPVGEQLGSADFALALSGEKHMALRRILQIAYSREMASPHVPQFIESVRQAVRGWTDGSVMEVFETVQYLAFEQYCRVMGRCEWKQHYRDFRAVTDMNMEVGGRVKPLWMFKWPPYRATRERVLKIIWGLVRNRRAKVDVNPGPADIVDTLMSQRFPDGRPMNDDEVVCYALYGFAGSCSYMGRLISFMLYEILRNPELHERLKVEVDAAFARGIEDAADVADMHLLRAVYFETLRFHPVSQGMPYVAAEDFEFNGARVEKGQLVVLSQLPMLFSEDPFTNPHTFDPARCMEPRNEHRKKGAFNPFGMHHRTCAAMGLVELMAMTMVATLLHEKDVAMSPSNHRLKKTVKPLPAPTSAFKMRVCQRGNAPSKDQVKAPAREELFRAAFPGTESQEVKERLHESEHVTVAPGEVIVSTGDVADAFYLVVSGSVEVWKKSGDAPESKQAVLRPGGYFGEIGLLCNIPRTATVRASSDGPVTLLKISADSFRSVVRESDMVSSEIARVMNKRIASNRLRAFTSEHPVEALASALGNFSISTHRPGSEVIRQGSVADRFYIIHSGEANVLQEGHTEPVATLRSGDYFGETGLIHHAPRNATVTATGSSDLVVVSCDRDLFHQLIHEADGKGGDLALALSLRLAVIS